MTNSEINRAVAEELGWRPDKHPHDSWWMLKNRNGNIVGRFPHGRPSEEHCWDVCNLDFCNDYNAAAEMRRAFDSRDRYWFMYALRGIISQGNAADFRLLDATPRQQSEAFLRMRGRWKEVEK
jgi:hypothetical protein